VATRTVHISPYSGRYKPTAQLTFFAWYQYNIHVCRNLCAARSLHQNKGTNLLLRNWRGVKKKNGRWSEVAATVKEGLLEYWWSACSGAIKSFSTWSQLKNGRHVEQTTGLLRECIYYMHAFHCMWSPICQGRHYTVTTYIKEIQFYPLWKVCSIIFWTGHFQGF
jgi:hypothetical protein